MLTPTITLYKDAHGGYYFRLRNDYEEGLFTSITYPAKFSCLRQLATLRETATADLIYKRVNGYNSYRFYIKVPKDPVMGNGHKYATYVQREAAIDGIKSMARIATVIDLTALVRYFRPVPRVSN